jgi:protoheme IX farnesyltransferase
MRLTFLVVFSASISFLIGSKANGGHIDWINWIKLIVGGFLVTSAANCFNEIIEKDLDKLMKRTMDQANPIRKMTYRAGTCFRFGHGYGRHLLLGSLTY